MTVKNNDDRRGAQRLPLPKPVPATFGGFAAKIIEVSLIGCQIEHADRVMPRARLPLRFTWRGAPVRVEATVVRSEMRSVGGKPVYISGLEFCQSIDQSPPVIRDVVEWLVNAAAKAAGRTEPATDSPARAAAANSPSEDVPFRRANNEDEEPELVSAQYLQCTFGGGKWMKLYVDEPKQPREGFTIPAPSNDDEVEVLCRAYEKANAERRRAMRASFELAIAQKRGL